MTINERYEQNTVAKGVITITETKVKPKYIFEDPNNPKEVEQILKKIILEKIYTGNLVNQNKVD